MQLALTLDLNDEKHRQILGFIASVYPQTVSTSVFGSVQTAVGCDCGPQTVPCEDPLYKKPTLVPTEQEVLPEQNKTDVKEAAESVKLPESNLINPFDSAGKMDTISRAKLAANARWERQRAIKEGRDVPPTQAEKKKMKKKMRKVNINRAEEQSLAAFEEQSDEAGAFTTKVVPPVDGRQLLEESWDGSDKSELEPDQTEIMEAVDRVQHSYSEAKASDKY